MRSLQVDFVDGDFVNPAYALQINVSYILSDITILLGHTIFLMYYESQFKKLSMIKKAEMVYQFQIAEPEAKEAFENFFEQQRQKRSLKHLPNNLFVLSKRMERDMEKILKDWIDNLCSCLKNDGFFAFSRNFDKGILVNYFFKSTGLKQHDLVLDDKQLFSNELANPSLSNLIWLLAEGFYSYLYFGEGAVTSIEAIEVGKPYLIKCLKVPNINLLTGDELLLVRAAIAKHTASFRAATDEWSKQCYTAKNGIITFKEKVMPLMETVQQAIDNDPILRQWSNVDSVKNTSAIYFGEVTPQMLWEYYKVNRLLSEEIYKQLLDEYATKENYTIPVMVFAYHLDSLILKTLPKENEEQQEWVASVKKYVEA